MSSPQDTAEEILGNLLDMHGVSEVRLIEAGIAYLNARDKANFIVEFATENNLLTEDEAREKYSKLEEE